MTKSKQTTATPARPETSFAFGNPAEPQNGAVELKAWHNVPFISNDIKGLVGKITVLSAQAVMGFDVNSNDSNWVVCVEGPSGARVYFPGCQVGGVCYFPVGAKVESLSPHLFILP